MYGYYTKVNNSKGANYVTGTAGADFQLLRSGACVTTSNLCTAQRGVSSSCS